MSAPSDSRGGAIATRGLLVQTLIALLDITKGNPPFAEITLEPKVGDDQFDFLWKNAIGSHATQVKSTENVFAKADVEKWAKKLEKARTNETCTLVLVGNIHPKLAKLEPVGRVTLKQKPLVLDGLVAEAAQRLAEFMETEGLHAGKAAERIMVVHAIESKLQHFSTDATVLTREAFLSMLREWITSAPRKGIRVDISRILKYAPTELIGREAEMKLLDDAWLKVRRAESPRPRVLTFVALGGEGKTSLVAKWAAGLAAQDWPGCDAAFAWSFYSQGTREQQAASSDLFLKAALTFFGDDSDAAFAASPAGAFEKGQRLARLVGQRRSLLILDGLEPLQYAPTAPTPGELKDQGIAALLRALAAASHGLCVVTTRYSLPDLRAFMGKTVREEKLTRLSRAAGVHLLKSLGVKGSELRNLPLKDGDEKSEKVNEFEKLVEDVKGHALTLTLLGGFLSRAFHGDIRQRDRVKFEKADEKMDGGHAFRTMAAYEQWLLRDGGDEGRREVAVLRLMGLFDRPADAGCLAALRRETIPGLTEPLAGLADDDWEYCLSGLETAKLLTVNRDGVGEVTSIDTHPLIRECFGCKMRTQLPEAWRVAHRCLYEFLLENTPRILSSLNEMEPLYYAVFHGCFAGLQKQVFEDVYLGRISGGIGAFSVADKETAVAWELAALGCFFERRWDEPLGVFGAEAKAFLKQAVAALLRTPGTAKNKKPKRPKKLALPLPEDFAALESQAFEKSLSALKKATATLKRRNDYATAAEVCVSSRTVWFMAHEDFMMGKPTDSKWKDLLNGLRQAASALHETAARLPKRDAESVRHFAESTKYRAKMAEILKKDGPDALYRHMEQRWV